MPLDVSIDLLKQQILSLGRIISERDPEFQAVSSEDLDGISEKDLKRIRQAYHELAYAPPSRS